MSSPLHCSWPGTKVGVAEGMVEVLAIVDDDDDVVAVVAVVRVVGPGVMRQEHPDETLDAGYCET